MVSEWMEHGTIKDFITAHPETNRLKLVSILTQDLIRCRFYIAPPVGGCRSWSEIPPRLAIRACRLKKRKPDPLSVSL
jgi:hypothetical protein